MKRYDFKQNKTAHFSAIAIAFFLHLGIFFWLNMPSKPKMMRQSISVTMVAPTTVAQKKEVEVKKPKEDFLKSHSKEKTRNVTKKIEKKKEFKKKKIEKADDRDLETSGQVSETATAQKSALVKPVFNAAYLNNSSPGYPSRAKRRRMQGEVILQVLVSKLGKALAVEIVKSSGYKLLDKTAKKSVQDWRFVPAYSGSDPVEATVLVPIEFKLN